MKKWSNSDLLHNIFIKDSETQISEIISIFQFLNLNFKAWLNWLIRGKFDSILFDSIHANESIFRFDSILFDSIRQFDNGRLYIDSHIIITYDYFFW